MHAPMLQRLFETSVQPNTYDFFLGLLIRRICRLLRTSWDLVGQCFHHDLSPSASKDELLQRIQVIWNSLSRADTQNLFDLMPRRVAELITARSGYTKY
ncbi:uncharacterized protein TNCV_1726131 [Trichonephila clavipes]|nr:uncharacterized protein TNCV_1726131 [Trichonephila clavipes]